MRQKYSKKVIVGINHYPHVNIFKNLINRLISSGHEVQIVAINRVGLIDLISDEIFEPHFIYGSHKKSFISKVIEILKRNLRLLFYLRKSKYDVLISMGGISFAQVSKLLSLESVIISDDEEYGPSFYNYKYLATTLLLPESLSSKGSNIRKFAGFKELAYLHPNYLKLNKDVLRNYGLFENKYVFMRLTDNCSLNYKENDLINFIKYSNFLIKKGYKVLISIENPLHKKYFANCIILGKPDKDYHSLIYFSLMSLSSGDSVARESALLGVPAIYTGGRKMAINKILEENGFIINQTDFNKVLKVIRQNANPTFKIESRANMNNLIKSLDDTTNILYNSVERG